MANDEDNVTTENRRDESAHHEQSHHEQSHDEQSRHEQPTMTSVLNASFGEMGPRNVRAALRLQTELFEVLHEVGSDWMARATSGAELAFRLPNTLTSAQTMPDALSAYQEWLNEWLAMVNEDSRRFIADSQKIVDKGVRCLTVASPSIATTQGTRG